MFDYRDVRSYISDLTSEVTAIFQARNFMIVSSCMRACTYVCICCCLACVVSVSLQTSFSICGVRELRKREYRPSTNRNAAYCFFPRCGKYVDVQGSTRRPRTLSREQRNLYPAVIAAISGEYSMEIEYVLSPVR